MRNFLLYGSITESINGFRVSSLAILLKKSFSESDGGVTVEMRTEPVEGETTLRRLGALKSMSPSCKYGMLWVGVGMSHLFSFDVHGVSSRTRTAVSTQCRTAPTCEQVSASPAIQVQ